MNIYFVQDERGPIKIGQTGNPYEFRHSGLQTGNPFELKLLLFVPSCKYTEKSIHLRFDKYRIRGEWFEPAPELLEFIEELRLEESTFLDSRDWEYRGLKLHKDYNDKVGVYTFRAFTHDENLYITKNYRKLTIPQMSIKLDRSEAAIARQIHWLLFDYLRMDPLTDKERAKLYDIYENFDIDG